MPRQQAPAPVVTISRCPAKTGPQASHLPNRHQAAGRQPRALPLGVLVLVGCQSHEGTWSHAAGLQQYKGQAGSGVQVTVGGSRMHPILCSRTQSADRGVRLQLLPA